MEAAPETARERRETAARFARVERWAEDSGNAALMGRELPPDEVLACRPADLLRGPGELQQGRAGGRDGRAARPRVPGPGCSGKDSRPRAATPAAAAAGGSTAAATAPSARRRSVGTAGRSSRPARARRAAPGGGAGGFAGRVTLTVPLGTAAGLADRPGELGGHGPVDPWLARDLVDAAARQPEDDVVRDGHRPARPRRRARLRPARTQEPRETRRPGTAGTGNRDGAGFRFTPASRDGPPGGYGTWRLRVTGRRAGPDRRDRLPRPPTRASTGTRPGATTPGPGSGTCPRSGTRPAPARCAGGPPPSATSSTTCRTRRAAGRACATAGPKCRHDHRLKHVTDDEYRLAK